MKSYNGGYYVSFSSVHMKETEAEAAFRNPDQVQSLIESPEDGGAG